MPKLRRIIIYICMLFQSYAIAQDTIAPVLVIPAQDTIFECGKTTKLTDKLTVWFNNAAGAVFEDNSGKYTIITNITLAQAITIFNNSAGTLCGKTQRVDVVFSAIDSAGNISLPDTASFYTTDTSPPTFNTVPNVAYTCHTHIRDTLIQWIQDKAGYVASDQCTDSVLWTNFTYGFFVNNVQISSGSGKIASGPYPIIPDGICDWTMKINFFAQDECQNQSITPGTTSFSVTDNTAPEFLNFPVDITVSCDKIPPVITPVVADGCTANIIPVLTSVSSQDSLPASCSHYNYIITRTWTATDKCGNSVQKTQTITVKDSIPPFATEMKDIIVSCDVFDNAKDSIFATFNDNCSPVYVIFSDTTLSTGCTNIFKRTYSVSDICSNSSIFQQQIRVIQDKKPVVTKPARNIALNCNDQSNPEGRFYQWVNEMGGSEAVSICGNIKGFAAIKGSYTADDPATFPGIYPTILPPLNCPSQLKGWIRYAEVDFVYYDDCDNVSITSGIFGIRDTLAPEIIQCSDKKITLNTAECQPSIQLKTPVYKDDCFTVLPQFTQHIKTELTSKDPAGPEAIVDTVIVHIGPINPFISNPINDGFVQISLVNMDIDDPSEYFNIFDEDGQFIGISPNGPMQCSSVNFDITLNRDKIHRWIQDGYIDLKFAPNRIQGEPVFSINNICGTSTIDVTLNFDVDTRFAARTYCVINKKDTIHYFNADSIVVELQQGINTIDFSAIDCAGNTTTCSQQIEVKDNVAPVVTCPSDKTIDLAKGKCSEVFSLPVQFATIENCSGNRLYNDIAPKSEEASFISYSYNSTKGMYEARNKQFIFNNVFPIRFMTNPVTLEVEFFGDNNEPDEVFEIYADDGTLIGTTQVISGTGCSKSSYTKFTIPYDQYNNWLTNNQITFLAVPVNGGNGINPCTELTGGSTTDRISYIKSRLIYSDASFAISVSGATTLSSQVIPNFISNYNMTLNGGKNTVHISTTDKAGNTGTCTFEINLRDTEPPLALCKNGVVEMHPSGLVNSSIPVNLINNGSTDNCSEVFLSISPEEVDCGSLDTNVSITLTVRDAQGNESQCQSLVKVNPYPLNPTYSSGLCSSDTLKLFANVPDAPVAGAYSFKWVGPQNTEFYTENPIITNPDESLNGVYVLTVTGFNGCTAVGSVVVNIKPLTNPVISTPVSTICAGTDLIISGTSYSGDISYDWYEGIFPTGVLISSTKTPELIITPASTGPHFYYMIARSKDCSSNPTPLLKITVDDVPVATVRELFLSPCEGGQIILSSSTTNPKYIYEWIGPGGFTAQGANPPSIKNVSKDQAGDYLLIVKNGSCISDTAVTRVNILESPETPVIAGLDIICEGNIFTLVATASSGAEKYEWYKNGILFTTTIENNLIIPNAQPSLQGEWTVRSFKGNCSSSLSKIKFVGVDAVLQIGATNSGPVCSGDSLTLQATFVPNATYMWSGPVNNIPGVHNPKVPGIPGDYTVTITTPTGCKSNANTTVTIIEVPRITALSDDAPSCIQKGSTISFQPSVFPNSNQYQYQWTGPNNYSSNIKNAVITNTSLADTGTYTLVVLNNICPSEPFSIQVAFNIIPDKPVINIPTLVCEGDTIRLQITNNTDSGTYTWKTPLGTVLTDTSSLILAPANKVNTGFYTVTSIHSGCTSPPSDTLRLSITPKPAAPVIDYKSPLCYGDSLKLSASHTDNAIYHWTGPNNNTFTGKTWDIPNSTREQSGFYTVITEVNGCRSVVSPSVEILVKEKITKPIFTNKELTVCGKDSNRIEICLQANSLTPNATYILTDAGNQKIITQGTNTCHQILPISDLGLGTHFIAAQTYYDGCYSLPSDNMVINVNIPPDIQADIIEDNLIACPDESLRLISRYGPPQVNIKWTASKPEIVISDDSAVSPIISNLPPGNNTIYLDYSVNGCPEFSRDLVQIYSEFKPIAENDNYNIPYGKNQLFNVLINDEIPVNSTISIVKQPEFGQVNINGNQIEYIPDPRSVSATSFTYKVCASYCEDLCSEAIVNITYDENIECFAPTIFTPNGDGYNDYFIIPCFETGKFPDNRVTVFNEWGVEVYASVRYKNDWDGTYGGAQLPAGTYFYIIETAPGNKPINGFLILQR